MAVVTGAAGSLGRAYSLELARRGARVVISDIAGVSSDEGPWADRVVEEIRELGGQAIANYDTVSTPAGGEAIVQSALDNFGTIDILINNAGFMRPAAFEDVENDQLRDVMDVHLFAGFNVTRPAWKVMKSKSYGRVVMTGSHSVFGYENNSDYVAAKAGLIGLVRALSLEGRDHGILTNCILPSATSQIWTENDDASEVEARLATATRTMGRRRTPESVAPMLVLLTSKECPVSGEVYSCLAGRYARVFSGVTSGWVAPPSQEVTAEVIAEMMTQINDPTEFTIPQSLVELFEAAAGVMPK